MKEVELFRYDFRQPDTRVEEFMRRFSKLAHSYFESYQIGKPRYWVLHGKEANNSGRLIKLSSDKSLLTVLNREMRGVEMTVDALGNIQMYVPTSPGVTCMTISLFTTEMLKQLPSSSKTQKSLDRQTRLIEDTFAHCRIDATWLRGLVELPQEKDEIVRDALGQFW